MAWGVALLILLIPTVQAARQEREIFNAIVLGFVLRDGRSHDLRFEEIYSRMACVEMRALNLHLEKECRGWGRQELDASAAALEKGC